jgi:triosephosphate isomerase
MTKKKIVIGNWKMNPLSFKEAEKLFTNIVKSVSGIKKTEIVICPPFLYLEKLKKFSRKISLGAQNVFWGDAGPFTGEISGEMLYDIGARYVIVGHSERRTMPVRQSLDVGGGETNEIVNKKIKAAVGAGLVPILCVGENMRDKNHEYLNFVKKQIEECLNGVSKNSISKIIVAYEPVWAIGRGAYPATPEEFREMNIFIRKILSDKFGVEAVENIRIIYGGSVDEKNAERFIQDGQADGFLPGRASLNPRKFSRIVQICETLNK